VTIAPIELEGGPKLVIVAGPIRLSLIDCVVALPATFIACTAIVSEPGDSGTAQLYEPFWTVAFAPLQVTVATPDIEPETVPETETGDDVKDPPFAGDAMLKTGDARSMFRVTLAVLVSPAVSNTLPVTT
jgi:hypothetical protein